MKTHRAKVVVVAVVLGVLALAGRAEAQWLAGYGFRKSLAINAGSEAGAGYQIQIVVGESSGAAGYDLHVEGNAHAFPDDIRFTDDDGSTELGHYLASTAGATPNRTATYWVKVNDDLDSAQSIYVYYGKSGDASGSDGDATFDFFDDFDGSSVDTAKWTVDNATGWSVGGGELRGQNTSGRLRSQSTFGSGVTLETKYRRVSFAENGQMALGFYVSGSDSFGWMNSSTDYLRNNGTWVNIGTGVTVPVIAQINARATQADLFVYRQSDDVLLKNRPNESNVVNNEPIAIGFRYDGNLANQSYDAYWDWIRVRKHAATAPALGTAGAEEMSSGGILWSETTTTNLTETTAWATATINTNLTSCTLVWDTTDKGTTNLSVWSGTNSLGAQSAGPVTGSATNLSADTGYVFRFYGEDGTTNGWSAAGSFITALSAAQAPVFTSTAATYDSVTLNWTDNASTESGYILQRSTNGVDYTLLAELAADTTSHIDTGVSPSTTYYYQLAATNSANGSSTDFALCATNVTTAASPIYWAGLAASAITASGATLTAEMTGNEGNVTAYWTTNTVTDPATEVWGGSDGPAAESIGTVSRTASGLLAETQYNYAFFGVNSTDGVEAWSVVATFLTGLSAAQNPAFTAVEATSSGTLSVSLAWTDNASTETAYVLQRSTSGSAGPYDVVATLPANSTSHVDYVQPSTTYHYRLFATNSVNATSTDPAACQSAAITTVSAGAATGGNMVSIYSENGTNYVAHIFTEAGTFEPRKALDVEYLIVAGGGGGGAAYYSRGGGGGGAGGLLSGTTNLTTVSYVVAVGAGGAGGGGSSGQAPNGEDSYLRNADLSIDFTAVGGGGGGNSKSAGAAGGSGGGGGSQAASAGGAGVTGQGNDGGDGNNTGDDSGGGGGGAGGLGGDAGVGIAGIGGAGLPSSIINGTPVTYAVGGTGSVQSSGTTVSDEAALTGNGGDSPSPGSSAPGGAGGSGVVVIRYQVLPSGTIFIFR